MENDDSYFSIISDDEFTIDRIPRILEVPNFFRSTILSSCGQVFLKCWEELTNDTVWIRNENSPLLSSYIYLV